MPIFLLHKPFAQNVIMPLFESFGCVFPNFGWALIISVIAFIYSLILTFVIEKIFPQIIGLSKKNTKTI